MAKPPTMIQRVFDAVIDIFMETGVGVRVGHVAKRTGLSERQVRQAVGSMEARVGKHYGAYSVNPGNNSRVWVCRPYGAALVEAIEVRTQARIAEAVAEAENNRQKDD